jgi:hypothetical protein
MAWHGNIFLEFRRVWKISLPKFYALKFTQVLILPFQQFLQFSKNFWEFCQFILPPNQFPNDFYQFRNSFLN